VFLCVSLNPAVDKRLLVERLQPGSVNRVTDVIPAPGGKAAHVAMVLRTLGADPLWLGFAGGSTGTHLVDGLRAMAIRVQAVLTASSTRVNLELVDSGGVVTEILEPGQPVLAAELQQLQDAFESILKASGEKVTAILSGSLPGGVPQNYYARLIALGHRHGCRMLVDSSGESLKHALRERPDFVKPNQSEAEWLTGSLIDGARSADHVLQMLVREGARSAAISLGEKGLIWQPEKQPGALFATVPEVRARSSVGSGDATLAGFAFAAEQNLAPADTLKLAAACGAANCLADGPGRARAEDIEHLRKSIQVEVMR